jgi:hypothetical protein
MFGSVCRTERLLVDSDGAFIDDSQTRTTIDITDMDILSFVEAENISDAEHIPAEYVKSCPYLLSFMEHYKYKSDVKRIKPNFSRRARQVLFVDERKLRGFEPLPPNNARLESLMMSPLGEEQRNSYGCRLLFHITNREGYSREKTTFQRFLFFPPGKWFLA